MSAEQSIPILFIPPSLCGVPLYDLAVLIIFSTSLVAYLIEPELLLFFPFPKILASQPTFCFSFGPEICLFPLQDPNARAIRKAGTNKEIFVRLKNDFRKIWIAKSNTWYRVRQGPKLKVTL
jgi:hypothetical protein